MKWGNGACKCTGNTAVKTKRIIMTVFGVLGTGVFAGLFQFIAFGVDPFQCFINGFYALIPMEFGTLYLIINVVLLLFALLADRHYIGLGTVVNIFLLGYVLQFTSEALRTLIPSPSLALRIVLIPVALLGLSAASSLYMTADLGVSAYDSVALIISNTWHKMQFRYCRVVTDLVCVVVGSALFLLSGKTFVQLTAYAGIGTVLTAFCMGPVISWCNEHISKPLLNK